MVMSMRSSPSSFWFQRLGHAMVAMALLLLLSLSLTTCFVRAAPTASRAQTSHRQRRQQQGLRVRGITAASTTSAADTAGNALERFLKEKEKDDALPIPTATGDNTDVESAFGDVDANEETNGIVEQEDLKDDKDDEDEDEDDDDDDDEEQDPIDTQDENLDQADPLDDTRVPIDNQDQTEVPNQVQDVPEVENNDNEDEVKENDKDNSNNESANEEDLSISSLKIPDLILELGVEMVPTSRAVAPKNHTVIETLIANYFENLWTPDIMGANYVSSELEANMDQSDNFGAGGSVLDLNIKGEAQFQGEPVPSKQELKERLMQYFTLWNKEELELYLADNGIIGAKVTNLHIEDAPLLGQNTTTTTTTPTTVTDNSANAANSNSGEKGKPVGLITGLTLFFVCLSIALVLLFRTRKHVITECGGWCKSKRDSMFQKNCEKRGWTFFKNEDRSDKEPIAEPEDKKGTPSPKERPKVLRLFESLSLPTKNQEKPSKVSQQNQDGDENDHKRQRPKILQWFESLSQPKKTQERPSQVLQHIQVLVDNDNILKQLQQKRDASSFAAGNRDYSYATESGAQFSAATVPHSNYGGRQHNDSGIVGKAILEDVSPQKTVKTCTSDEDEISLEDPVVRYAPPTRAKSRLYKERADDETECTPSTVKSTPSPRDQGRNRHHQQEDDGLGILGEWANFLNPCMPTIPLYQHESERLDDLVGTLPRDKSILDGDSDAPGSPSPPRRSANQSSSSTRSGDRRTRSGDRRSFRV